ncbi:MAG: hypothetical protein IBJ08_17340 [Pseudomonas sp.]|nr:hypothetical protein [Pseudomonas sp.]
MKKIVAATLFAGLFSSVSAFAAGVPEIDVELDNGYNELRAAGNANINLAQQVNIQAQANRAGFVKNNFQGTLSANVAAGVNEDSVNNRFGSVAGSNKGYTVFTGSSVGGSVSQCGPQVDKGTADLAASLVEDGTLVLANANGCGL